MKTLLLNPPPERNIEPYDAPPYPHIGIGYLASYLRSKNCSVTVLDAKLGAKSISDTIEMINEIKPDIIGITAFTQEIIHVACIAKVIKDKYPLIPIVIGGVHATVLPLQTLREFSVFDFVIFGEGEITLYELIKALMNSEPFNQIKGLGFRKQDKIYINEPREWILELDKLPFPAWDLFPQASIYPVLTARGCPYRCVFCSRPYGVRVRERSPENVIAEVKELVSKYKACNITIRDETFGINRARAIKICDMLIHEKLNEYIEWDVETRVDVANRELLEKMKMAGCSNVGFGIESGNAEILKSVKKRITLEQAENAVKTAKKIGLGTSSYFILGMPYETKKTAWDTINFARKLNTDSVSIAIMIPFPKTEIEEMLKKGEGGYKQISYRWSDYNKQTGAVVELKSMSRRTLVFFQIIGYLICYLCNFRVGAFMRNIKSRFKQVSILIHNLFRR